MVLKHLKKVRSDNRYRNSTIIFCPEVNLGLEGERFARDVIKKVENTVIYKGENGERNGIWTLNKSKVLGMHSARKALDSGSCSIDPNVMSGLGTPRSDLINRLRTQLSGLKPVMSYTRAGGEATMIVSGKYDENNKISKGKQDDLAIMFILQHYVADMIISGNAWGINPRDYFS
jgi:uncharacterized protein YbbK (DUF523 family)